MHINTRAERNLNFERLAVVGSSIALTRDQKRDLVLNFHGHLSIDFALSFGGVCGSDTDTNPLKHKEGPFEQLSGQIRKDRRPQFLRPLVFFSWEIGQKNFFNGQLRAVVGSFYKGGHGVFKGLWGRLQLLDEANFYLFGGILSWGAARFSAFTSSIHF